jgi:hypothetical protein
MVCLEKTKKKLHNTDDGWMDGWMDNHGIPSSVVAYFGPDLNKV